MHNESKCEEEKKESFAPKTTGMLFSPEKNYFFPVLIVLLLVNTVHSDGARYIKLRSMPVIPYKIIDNRFSQGESCV